VPGEAHDDHGQQDRAGDGKVSRPVRCFQALKNWPNLQADEDERQDVQREHDRLPHGISGYACPSLSQSDQAETLRLTFSLHNVEIEGRNLRALLLAVQDFAVKWVRVMPERYHQLEAGENGVVSRIHIQEAK